MRQRLKLLIAYDGAHFAGWQSQLHGNTVQDHLERALAKIAGEPVRVHGAGRTDAGVHALGQCAHIDVHDRLPPSRWTIAVNAALPPQIRVLRSQPVSVDFHARFSAVGKVYRYRIWSGAILPPLEYGRVWHLPRELNAKLMDTAAAVFVGLHDFAGFAANRGRPEPDTFRTLHSVVVRRRGFCWSIEIDGDGFLYKMVRLMVGAIVDCATGKLETADVVARLERAKTIGARTAAPAVGLYLMRVRY
jgi:tRNA pseudouridine38-40 synthase